MGGQGFGDDPMTLGGLVEAVIDVSEDEREVVAVVVHLLESGRVRRPSGSRKARRRARAREVLLRRTG
ncbi:MAG TPA: hypothetical protein VMW19_20785 [Myxococcota bacterium]|nr:hypothetical protein [Myxococcota bacterium]